MKNSLILFAIISTVFVSCNKTAPVPITYHASGAISTFTVKYTDANGNLQTTQFNPQSAQDVWQFSFNGEQGDIVYVSGKYTDAYSALKLMIKINGKVYKQASNEGDTLHYLTVSGVIPYE